MAHMICMTAVKTPSLYHWSLWMVCIQYMGWDGWCLSTTRMQYGCNCMQVQWIALMTGASSACTCMLLKFLQCPHSRIAVAIEASRWGLYILLRSWVLMWSQCIWTFVCSSLASWVTSSFVTLSLWVTVWVGVVPPRHQSLPLSIKYPSLQCLAHLHLASVEAPVEWCQT